MIVIGTDLGTTGRAAFDEGVALARDLDTSVLLVHAIQPPAAGLGLAGAPAPRDVQAAREGSAMDHALQLTQEWLEEARKQGIGAEGMVEAADAAELIVAASEAARFVVVGTHQRKGVGRLLLGSVAEAVLRESKCPVLVVPNPRA